MSKNPQDADQSKSRRISIPNSSDKSPDAFLAELALNGVINSATLAVDFSRDNYGELSLTDCIRELSKKTRSVHAGNLQDAETLCQSKLEMSALSKLEMSAFCFFRCRRRGRFLSTNP